MERNIKIIYRIAEKANKNNKLKPEWVNNETCLKNIAKHATNADLIVFGDRLTETKELAQKTAQLYFNTRTHGNANTFLEVLDWVLDNLDDEDIIGIVEDDYLYRPSFTNIVKEGLKKFDYVTMYSHPDRLKYKDGLGLEITESTYWERITSTTMSFFTTVKMLRFDYEVFKRFTENQQVPLDYYLWKELTKTRTLASPIPAFSTHGEISHLAPCIDWKQYI